MMKNKKLIIAGIVIGLLFLIALQNKDRNAALNECQTGTYKCISSTVYRACTTTSQGYRIWGPAKNTLSGYTCNNGLISKLGPACAPGTIKCTSKTTYQKCQLAEGMAWAWYPTNIKVSTGYICQNNQIVKAPTSTFTTWFRGLFGR